MGFGVHRSAFRGGLRAGDPAFDALPGAKAFFGKYDGGLYKHEIPDNWNGELALYAFTIRAART